MSGFRGLDDDEGWIRREIAKLRRELQEMSAARRLVIATAWAQNDSPDLNLTTGFTRYLDTPVTVPAGYTRAIVQMFASAGVTYDGASNGNIGIQARATGSAGTVAGPALSNGKTGGGAISVNTGLATRVAVTPGTPLMLHTFAYADGATPVDLTGNVHLSATVIFTRG